MSREITEEVFLKDVADHKMTVLRDDGLYRHLHFASTGQHSWNQWFEIITWPGKLAYSGDMGTYVFARIEDMFQFFRTKPREGKSLYVNLGYWGEKLEAVERHSGYKEYDPDLVRQKVKKYVDEWIDYNELSKEDAEALREELDDEIVYDGGHQEAYRTLDSFSHKVGEEAYWHKSTRDIVNSRTPDFKVFQFQDIFEWKWEDYTGHYVWCCYALAWSIKQYDEMKDKEVAA